MKQQALLLALSLSMTGTAWAQLSTNPDKFLGNITTYGQVNPNGIEFADLWNQITPENESKWQSVEGTRDVYRWSGCDNAYNYAREHNFPFKFHTLVWGSQYPTWITSLSTQEQYEEIEEWMDEIQKRYPDLEMIDVVNEAIAGHAPAPFKDALGGDGTTGYDWIIKAFEMAAERWPDAILIYNDYNTFQWQKTEFINLVKVLRNAGAPIDAYGCQSHDLNDMNFSDFKKAMKEIQDALQIPMYSTEYDIATTDDAKQKQQYSNQIKYMWEQDYVAGITLWGYIYGATWTDNGNSGIIRNGQDRPAMTWLREYMASDEAKTAKSPFPGMKKEASIYIKPSSYNATIDKEASVTVNARLSTKTIDHVDLYADGQLLGSWTEAPYQATLTPTQAGDIALKAIVYDTEGNQYQRIGGMRVRMPRVPFLGEPIAIPGTIEAENFDKGGEGVSFHDSDSVDEGGTHYRSDNEGVDLVAGNGTYALGYTANGEWVDYTINVTTPGKYAYEATVSSGSDNSGFTIALIKDDKLSYLTSKITVPNGGSWDVYTTMKGNLAQELTEGEQIIRIMINSPYVNIDKIKFICTEVGLDQITSDDSTSTIFDLTGRRVSEMLPGQVYIVDGKKVMK